LQATGWDLDQAVSLYFEERASNPLGAADEEVAAAAEQSNRPAAGPATSSTGRRQPAGRPQQMSFSDLQRSDQDDDDEEEKGQDLFTGGEKSGLAVQNPDQPPNHFRNIMQQARQNRPRPPAHGAEDEEEEEEEARPSNFTGRAQTLGGDDAPSRIVSDPSASTAASSVRNLPRVTRTLHLWQDGVSVDDGPLFRFDDPANATILQDINQGRAPRTLLDVQPGQEVDLNLDPHKGENYVAPKKQFKPFSGQGQRLGSPTPGLPSTAGATTTQPSTQSTSVAPSQSTTSSAAPQIEVDSSQPTLQMQIRLGSGARLSSRFNTTHTIGDIYDFVDRASTESVSRPYALQTTFPTTEFNDRARVLGDITDFKRGGVLVQKWK
jgi:UBX domain-containing protein 1